MECMMMEIQGWFASPQGAQGISIVFFVPSRDLDFICGIYPVTVYIDWRGEVMDCCLI